MRPLLPFTRAETRAYCAERGLPFADDPTNEEVRFARARVRHRVLPELRAINPAAEEAIARLAALATEEERLLNGMAAAALERLERPPNGELAFLTRDVELVLDRGGVAHLPAPLRNRALRLAVGALGGSLDARQTQALAGGLAFDSRGSITAEGGAVVASWDERRLHFRRLEAPAPFRFGVTMPGETESDEFGWRLVAFEGPPGGAPIERAALRTQLDRAKLRGSLYFRSAKPGDEMRPIGFDHRRKLSDLLAEAGLTPAARARLPIVCDFVGPIWAPGVCLDERVRRDAESRSVWNLRLEPIAPQERHNEETRPNPRT